MSGLPSDPGPEARERILRAAERLFAARGYAAASVQEITDAAQVNRALLYYYFADKHSLYATIITEGVAEFSGMLDRALSVPGTHADRLAAFVRGHLELIWSRGELARIVHRCLLDGNQEEFGLVERFQGCVTRLEDLLRDAAAAGEFREVDPGLTARAFIGPTFIFSLWRLSEGERFDRDAVAAQVTDLLLHGLRRG